MTSRGTTLGSTTRYTASRFYRIQTRGGYLAGLSAGSVTGLLGLLGLFLYPIGSEIWFIALAFLVNAIATMLLLFPGRFLATYPIAVEVGTCIRVITAFTEVAIEFEEVARVYDSWLRQGFVIELRRRRGALRYVIIHWLFGPERKPLMAAIRVAMEERTHIESGR